jgi:hypothetical protein
MSSNTDVVRAAHTNLSTSWATDGASAEAATIHAVDPLTNHCDDRAEQCANHPPVAPPAQLTRRSILMNSIVSAAAVASATAIPSQSVHREPFGEVSFPGLVARFVKVQQRCDDQREKDQMRREVIHRLFSAETGLPPNVMFPPRPKSARWRKLDAIRSRLWDQNPDPDMDQNGASIAWPDIQDELYEVAKEMLDRGANSLTDLAWQAEALWIIDRDDSPDVFASKLINNIRSLTSSSLMSPDAVAIGQAPDPLIEIGDKFDEAAKQQIETNARSNELFEPIHEAVEAQATWPDDQEKWTADDAKTYLETRFRVIDDIGAEWTAVTNELQNVHHWRTEKLMRAIWDTPARDVTGLGIKAKAAALACNHYWDTPFDELDWEVKGARALIDAVLDAAGLPPAPQFLGIDEA